MPFSVQCWELHLLLAVKGQSVCKEAEWLQAQPLLEAQGAVS